jgi:outer membrane usher protein
VRLALPKLEPAAVRIAPPAPGAGPEPEPSGAAAAAAGPTAAAGAIGVGPVWPEAGGPPQPTVGRRRDPVDTPLLDDQAWRSWVLAVRLNGTEVSQGSLFLESREGGQLMALAAQLRLWRVKLDDTRLVSMQGELYYPLDAVPGLEQAVDREGLAIVLTIPPSSLEPFDMENDEPAAPLPAQTGTGGFLDYDLLVQAGNGVPQGVGSLVEIGAFGSAGVLTSSLQASDFEGDPSITRLDTTFTRDLPDRRKSLRLGDSLTFGGAFAQPVRFGGIQWATNFAVDPTFVTFPTPAIGGLADQQSVVDVFINNIRQATGDVPAGPFRIGNIPVVTGAGEVQLVVRDLLGRERIVTQPYYVSARLLRQGLHDFSYAAGFQRKNYGDESFDYGDALVSATHRYGLTDSLTLEGHADGELKRQTLAGGGSLRLGRWGVLSGGLGLGLDEGEPGALVELAYEYQSNRFSFGARTSYRTDDFAQAGNDFDRGTRIDQLNLGVELGSIGRLGFLAINQQSHDREDIRSLAATYSIRAGSGNLMLRGARLMGPDDDYALMAIYSVPLGNNRSTSLEIDKTSEGPRARAQFRQGRGASDLGLDYRIAAEIGHEAEHLDARFSYQTTKGAGEVEVERFEGDNNIRAGVTGSIGFVDGQLALSRRLGEAFGMVSTPGFSNVRVYLDNREIGRTDADGRLMLPELRPFEANRVRLEVDDLPLDAQVGNAEAVAVPFARSGVSVGFDLQRVQQATARLVDGTGQPLPAGLRLTSQNGAAWAWVGKDGFAQIAGAEQPVEVAAPSDAGRLSCTIPALPHGEVLPDLGELRCR